MAQWGNTDDAANSVIWASESVNQPANTANRNALFGNTTANAYFDGVTVGQFGVDTDEMAAARDAGDPKPPHAGWVLKTEGSGGRAGRTTYETLVAMGTMSGDAEDGSFPDLNIRILTQPQDDSANSASDEQATFTVETTSVPSGSLTFLWQYTANTSDLETFSTTVGEDGFSGQTTATLTADANTIADGTLVRVVVSGGGDSVTSDSAELTVT